MKRTFLAILCVGVMLFISGCSTSTTQPTSAIHIKNSWVRAVPPNAPASAAYMEIHNTLARDLYLIGGESDISEFVELHTVVHENDMMSMRKIDNIMIPAQGQVLLKPMSNHIMLINLKKSLAPGDQIHLTLKFQDADDLQITIPVQEKMMPSSMPPLETHEHHQMMH
ncbi:MAG: copper chaperone PCu(A)C [SAR324 cluster bacterium]|nr:copper chaperone PCu(A)C [SAR324 cluster bacterium]